MNTLDKLFCYYYIYCKEKAWFANDSYGTYAWGSLGIFISLFIFLIAANVDSMFDTQFYFLLLGKWHEKEPQLKYGAFGVLFITLFLLAIYLLSNNHGKKLAMSIDLKDESAKSRYYKVGTLFNGLLVILAVNFFIFGVLL